MKRLLLIFTMIPLLSGSGHQAGGIPCNCPVDSADTSIPAAIKDSVNIWATAPVDSVRTVLVMQRDSLKEVYDSLTLKVRIMQAESKKKAFIGERDTSVSIILKDHQPVRNEEGRIKTRRVVWLWYYWRYPDGEVKFHKTLKKRLPDGTL
jgi:hypothetical protein